MKQAEYIPINLEEALSKMKWWAKEKDSRYREQKKLVKSLFGSLIKKLGIK